MRKTTAGFLFSISHLAAILIVFPLILLPAQGAHGQEPTNGLSASEALIDSLWTSGGRGAALELLEEELSRTRNGQDEVMLAKLLVRKGAYSNFLGQLVDAEHYLDEGLALARAQDDSTLQMSGTRWLALVVGGQGRRDEAMSLYQELLDLGAALNDRPHQGWAQVGMAWTYWRQGQGEKALLGYEKAAEFFRGSDDVQGELWANNGIASLNNDLGRYDEARTGYLGAIEVARHHDQPLPEAIALNNLGSLEYSLGRFDEALERFQHALAIQAELGNKRNQLQPMFNISICWNQLGNYQQARQVLDEALVLCEKEGYRDLKAQAMVKMAQLETNRKHFHEAARLIEMAMADGETVRQKDVIEGRIELGSGYSQIGNFSAAARQLAMADSLLGDKDFNWVRLRLYANRARLFADQEDFASSLDQYLKLSDLVEQTGFSEFRVGALAGAGQACLSLGQVDQAQGYFESAAQAWESDRRLLLSPQWREMRGNGGRQVFAELATLVHQSGQPEKAFNLLQSYKARTLMERMLGPGQEFNAQLAMADADLATLADLQNHVLGEKELLLDFTLGNQRSLVFAVSRDTMVLRPLPAMDEITDKVFTVFNLHKRPDAGSVASLAAVGAGLADLLLADLPDLFPHHDQYLVAADGALNLLPFSALEIDGIDRVWTRVPSASILKRLRGRGESSLPSSQNVLALGSNWSVAGQVIPGALAEVDYLASRFEHVQKVIMSGQESSLPDLAPYGVLHLAAHTSNDDQNPWQSAIQFLPDQALGNLRAADILHLDLSAQLAVLSSCSSGSGRVLNGEGVVGLSSALFSVGVPTVVASLWPVDDAATAGFMEFFYNNLADGDSFSQALAAAQQELRGQAVTEHPYYWAGFVVLGEGNGTFPLEKRPDRRLWQWLALAALMLALVAWTQRRTSRKYSPV